MTYQLREYQRAAVDGLWTYLGDGRGTRPLIVVPTGGGKSLILAAICREWMEADPDAQILVVTHVKELVEQNAEKLTKLIGEIGVHSAGLGRRDVDERVIVGGVQSLVNRVADLGPRHVVIVDEAHRIPRDGEGQYRTLLRALRPRVLVGLTATPGRMDSGALHEGEGALFDGIAYEVGMVDLIREGYLSKLRPQAVTASLDLSGARIERGDFVLEDLADQLEDTAKLGAALDEWVAAGRRKTLVFCASVKQAGLVLDMIRERGKRAELVTGETKPDDRAAWIAAYKAGELDALVNVMVLTTGFDAPETDCLVVFRPTASTGLYVQMMGRGSRIAEGKADCLVLDFAENVSRHGPVSHPTWQKKKSGKDPLSEEGPLVKTCKGCGALIALSATTCEFCGEACPRQTRIRPNASTLELIDMGEPCELRVMSQIPRLHYASSGNVCLKIEFWAAPELDERPLLYTGWYVIQGSEAAARMGRGKLRRALGIEIPEDPDAALAAVDEHLRWRVGATITVRRDGKYLRVESWRPGEPMLAGQAELDDLPF